MAITRYQLTSFYNLRDGGALSTPGGHLRTLRLLRSDNATTIDSEETGFFEDLPLVKVIDLRDQQEIQMQPSAFKTGGFTVVESPIFVSSAPAVAASVPTVAELYQTMLRGSAHLLAAAVDEVAEGVEKGTVLVHCTAGKDRTGVVVAMIQDMLGVPRQQIAQSYALSQANLDGPWVEKIMAAYAPLWGDRAAHFKPLLVGSPEEAILGAFSYVDNNFGTTKSYLSEGGLSEDALGALKAALVKK